MNLFAEPTAGGWIIADKAGVNQRPGMVYLSKRAAVADIRAIHDSRVEVVTIAPGTASRIGNRWNVTNHGADDLLVYPEIAG